MRSLNKEMYWIQMLNNGIEIVNKEEFKIFGRIQQKGYQTSVQAQIAEVPSQTYALIDTKYADLDYGLGDLIKYKEENYQITGVRKIENESGNRVLYTKLTLTPSSITSNDNDNDFNFGG